ncbi:hypothetical protein J2T58_001463 [Methanocalculus alkaliphilus]|nr:hypothetical protein [Methanocalculus alkaliphilus]
MTFIGIKNRDAMVGYTLWLGVIAFIEVIMANGGYMMHLNLSGYQPGEQSDFFQNPTLSKRSI